MPTATCAGCAMFSLTSQTMADARALVFPGRLSNLDSTGRAVIKKGAVVSYHGLRMSVIKVSRGYYWGVPLNVFGKVVPDVAPVLDRCAHVQVVA